MGVDHEVIFAYGFLLKPFERKDEVKLGDLDKFIYNLSKEVKDVVIEYATDGYYNMEVFVFIAPKGEKGFRCSNRGYNTFKGNKELKVSFEINEREIEVMNKVKEEFKSRLLTEKPGWMTFYYSH